MKPRIKIWRNFRGEIMWQCVGFSVVHTRSPLIGRGKTPAHAFSDWQEACDLPF